MPLPRNTSLTPIYGPPAGGSAAAELANEAASVGVVIPPLAGVRVLDMTRLLPGPMCTLYLADLGADVIKVEDTGAGDYARALAQRPGAPGTA